MLLVVFAAAILILAVAAVVLDSPNPPNPSDSAVAVWHSQKRTDYIRSSAAVECNWRIVVSSRRNAPCAIYRLNSLFVSAGRICLNPVLLGAA